MEITTHIYPVSDIPEEITTFLQNNYDDLADLLNIHDYEIPNTYSFFEDLYENPIANNLPPKIIEDVRRFSSEILGINLHDLETRYVPTEENLEYLLNIFRSLSKQTNYAFGEEKDCKIWFITAEINRQLYGGVFVFWNRNFPNHIVIQGITKFLAPSLLALFYPEQESRLPRLNSILGLAVETVARSVGAKQIYVAPIGKQGRILEKHYGYRKTSSIIYPCELIIGSNQGTQIYVKDIFPY
jgi:hypothetical protein